MTGMNLADGYKVSHTEPAKVTDMTVANTILAQYGGGAFVFITGAKNLNGSENSLTFRIPDAKNKIITVVTTLMPSDTYKVEYLNCRMTEKGPKREVVSVHEDVYSDQLQDIFERETGLYTTLTPRKTR